MKNSQMNGADRFKQKILLFSEACLATFRIDSKDTVRKNPFRIRQKMIVKTCAVFETRASQMVYLLV